MTQNFRIAPGQYVLSTFSQTGTAEYDLQTVELVVHQTVDKRASQVPLVTGMR